MLLLGVSCIGTTSIVIRPFSCSSGGPLLLQVFFAFLASFFVVNSKAFGVDTTSPSHEAFHYSHAVFVAVLLHDATSLIRTDIHTLFVSEKCIQRHPTHEGKATGHDDNDRIGRGIR